VEELMRKIICLLIVASFLFVGCQKQSQNFDAESRGFSFSNNTGGEIATYNDYFYYAGNDGMYKVKSDGTDSIKISDQIFSPSNVLNDWIYGVKETTEDISICCLKTDGTGYQELTSAKQKTIDTMYVADETIYYHTTDKKNMDNQEIRSININGTNDKKILSNVSLKYFYKGNIYYTDNKTGYLYSLDVANNKKTQLSKINTDYVSVTDECVYYYSWDSYYSVDFDGKNGKVVLANAGNKANLIGDYLYYIANDDVHSVHKYNLQTAVDKTIFSVALGEQIYGIYSIGKNVFLSANTVKDGYCWIIIDANDNNIGTFAE